MPPGTANATAALSEETRRDISWAISQALIARLDALVASAEHADSGGERAYDLTPVSWGVIQSSDSPRGGNPRGLSVHATRDLAGPGKG